MNNMISVSDNLLKLFQVHLFLYLLHQYLRNQINIGDIIKNEKEKKGDYISPIMNALSVPSNSFAYVPDIPTKPPLA